MNKKQRDRFFRRQADRARARTDDVPPPGSADELRVVAEVADDEPPWRATTRIACGMMIKRLLKNGEIERGAEQLLKDPHSEYANALEAAIIHLQHRMYPDENPAEG